MFGDLILWIKKTWKQFWCIHDYQWQGKLDYRYNECTKCGRIKSNNNRELFVFVYILITFLTIVVGIFIFNRMIHFIKYGTI